MTAASEWQELEARMALEYDGHDETPSTLSPVEQAWFAVHDERRALRRDVAIECCVVSAAWDEPQCLDMCDLSPFGAFVRTPAPLAVGTSVVVCFTPPGWDSELEVFADVVRNDAANRAGGGGMAIAFSGMTLSEHFLLTDALLAEVRAASARRDLAQAAP